MKKFMCPTTPHPLDTRPPHTWRQAPRGCGALFEVRAPAPGGWLTCPHCRLQFNPADELRYAERRTAHAN